MESKDIYPGHGACELCGEVDPCYTCVGAPLVIEKTKEHAQGRMRRLWASIKREIKDEQPRVDG